MKIPAFALYPVFPAPDSDPVHCGWGGLHPIRRCMARADRSTAASGDSGCHHHPGSAPAAHRPGLLTGGLGGSGAAYQGLFAIR